MFTWASAWEPLELCFDQVGDNSLICVSTGDRCHLCREVLLCNPALPLHLVLAMATVMQAVFQLQCHLLLAM